MNLLLLLSTFVSVVGAKEIRVGITEYQNVESTYDKYQNLFQELEQLARKNRTSGEDVTFRFAIGTYAEVIDWYNKKLIDVAVLSAMPIADLLTTSNAAEIDKIKDAYLGSLNPVGGRDAKCGENSCQRSLDEKAPQCVDPTEQPQIAKTEYHTSCIVPAEYGWKNFDDVKKFAGQNKLKFLFVRPVSISGYIVPAYYLKEQGIDLGQEEFDFTYQHQDTLQRMLQEPLDELDRDKYLVAFVIDDTPYCVPKADSTKQKFTKLDTPDLSSINIPHEAILVNYNLDEIEYKNIKETMRQLLAKKIESDKITKNKKITFTLHSGDPEHTGDWVHAYDTAAKIYETVKVPRSVQNGSSFSDFIKSLKTYKQSTNKEPRLALVLSGGGAKCAYQAGAIVEIENRLQQLRADPNYKDIDFNLIVGTSGGAINALLAALGGTKDPQAQDYIRKMWSSFRQQEFFTPSPVFNLIFGLCLGLLQALAITFAVLLFGRKRIYWTYIGKLMVGLELAEISLAAYLDMLSSWFAIFVICQVVFIFVIAGLIRLARMWAIRFLNTQPGHWWAKIYNQKVGDWWRIAGWLMLLISAAEFIIVRWPGPSLWPTNTSHTVYHLWMIVTLICSVSYPWPLLLGLLMVLSGITGRFEIDWNSRRLWLVRGLTLLVVVLAGILVLDSLWKETSPSNTSEIENAFIIKIPEMLTIIRPGFSPATGSNSEEKLQDISRRIINDPSLLQRDLVITVSNLPLTESVEESTDPKKLNANQLPEDLYFFYSKNPQVKGGLPPNEKRFVDFRDNPGKLLDVVIGSGTIYPLFPYRELRMINLAQGKTVDRIKVIDGGFIHNSPIEAAIKWGATHIISIEASPLPKPFDPVSTLDHFQVAFKYIMAQTQRMDDVARGEVEIFELRPRSKCDKKSLEFVCKDDPEPNMDTFDFTPALTDNAFKIGMEDAASVRPLFKRVPGPPLLRKTKQ
jgi:predicted acylesterase/phospholipase RssA/ABC-type phosphate/phosphonate transport system substrate-binding protein